MLKPTSALITSAPEAISALFASILRKTYSDRHHTSSYRFNRFFSHMITAHDLFFSDSEGKSRSASAIFAIHSGKIINFYEAYRQTKQGKITLK
ncbi:hypothetical protein BpHYR1_047355 [Brachionus plicatilis]|uniref:Uncharacterized protein n=1 Tax=Brachionus plicatilis TaxID=10195 RepID=A0A3M7Q845_BRAPC|nr:hypothetical protein BpHYR1_047355 [Brachionus plicatilis]